MMVMMVNLVILVTLDLVVPLDHQDHQEGLDFQKDQR